MSFYVKCVDLLMCCNFRSNVYWLVRARVVSFNEKCVVVRACLRSYKVNFVSVFVI